MTTPEILRQAAKEVRCGWVKGERHDPHGVCALGGMENAAWFDDTSATNRQPPAEIICPEAVRALAQLVPSVSRSPIDVWNQGMSIGDWNDGIDQTAENVAATMELAAICFEQAHAQPETTTEPEVTCAVE